MGFFSAIPLILQAVMQVVPPALAICKGVEEIINIVTKPKEPRNVESELKANVQCYATTMNDHLSDINTKLDDKKKKKEVKGMVEKLKDMNNQLLEKAMKGVNEQLEDLGQKTKKEFEKMNEVISQVSLYRFC
jgi:hypothetical protein